VVPKIAAVPEMHDVLVSLCLLASGGGFYSILFVFSTFSYEITSQAVIIHWRILGRVPFGTSQLPLETITEVRRFSIRKDMLRGAHVLGNLPSRRGVLLFRKTHFLPVRRVWVTPPDPDVFIARLRSEQLGRRVIAT
jgi:hypothetical protein